LSSLSSRNNFTSSKHLVCSYFKNSELGKWSSYTHVRYLNMNYHFFLPFSLLLLPILFCFLTIFYEFLGVIFIFFCCSVCYNKYILLGHDLVGIVGYAAEQCLSSVRCLKNCLMEKGDPSSDLGLLSDDCWPQTSV
jgi:hypothetical protein